MRSDLVKSYGQDRLPRYTSYPTAPHFSSSIGEADYRSWLESIPVRQAASVYLHVPFCRSMCWYCGCHTSVTKRDDPIAIYASGLRTEARLVAETIGQRLPISHVHFGGGTPTIMTPETFADLVGALRYSFFVLPDAEIAVEIDPRTLTDPMAETLGYCGVNRASLGVQSFDPAAQRAINRLQSFEQTAFSVERLRRAGVKRLNFDLLYGLPAMRTFPRSRSISARSRKMRCLTASSGIFSPRPSQKPWSMPATSASASITSPSPTTTSPWQSGKAGCVGISRAIRTTAPTRSSVWARAPSAARLKDRLATAKGYAFTNEDRFRADIIERIMCDMTVDLPQIAQIHGRAPDSAIVDRSRIESLIADGAVTMTDDRLSVRDGAEFLVRSVASAFDAHLARSTATHSRAV